MTTRKIIAWAVVTVILLGFLYLLYFLGGLELMGWVAVGVGAYVALFLALDELTD